MFVNRVFPAMCLFACLLFSPLTHAQNNITVVSAASRSASSNVFAAESKALIFGRNLASGTLFGAVTNSQLPTQLLDVRVAFASDILPNKVYAELLLVSPTQIDFLIPALPFTTYSLRVERNGQIVGSSTINVTKLRPEFYTVKATLGSQNIDVPLVQLLQVYENGGLFYFQPIKFDVLTNQTIAQQLVTRSQPQNFLVVYASGIRARANASSVSAFLNNYGCEVLYAGSTDGSNGLDQINIRLPSFAPNELPTFSTLTITVDGQTVSVPNLWLKHTN